MSDLISREAAIKIALEFMVEYFGCAFDEGLQEKLIGQMKEASTELTLCKDCKWYGSSGCAIRIVDDTDRPKENDFCSFAERKDDEE